MTENGSDRPPSNFTVTANTNYVSTSAELSTLSNMDAGYLLGKSGNDLITAFLLMLITFLVMRLLKD